MKKINRDQHLEHIEWQFSTNIVERLSAATSSTSTVNEHTQLNRHVNVVENYSATKIRIVLQAGNVVPSHIKFWTLY